ncbi:hypothetical protein BGI41_00010 [Methanobrevibacter sp. 87.7]|uniref:Ig-like domain-containing protein n=1 Tax=Methanobrevibacter sp. 87.7 TaxID=387957 RepID=UPI000B513548|nr:Ig-like domain-containing protein [Methanobrevibacter sp. 87.7]OWT33869.1 hypothetical protein BGI41_00010 [Methanobrevibacter sp. 87.7]
MDYKKSILIFSILAIFFLCISGISATDLNDTNSNTVNQVNNAQIDLNNSVYENSNIDVLSENEDMSFDVENNTFFNYFTQDGFLNKDIVPEGSTFNLKGNFSNITNSDGNVLDGITFDFKVNINGINATIYDTSICLANDDITLNNLKLINSEQDSAIMVGGNNITINNVSINQSNKNSDSYGIYVDSVSNVNIINNNIVFNGNTRNKTYNFPIYVSDSSDILIENNSINNTVPSVPLDYDTYYNVICYNGGISIISTNKVSFKNNKINTTYSDSIGSYDTLYNIFVKGVSDFDMLNNVIITNGNSYVYGVNINGISMYDDDGDFISSPSTFILDNNTINVNSNNYANGIYVNGPSTGNITNNHISSTGVGVSYPIASAAWSGAVNVNYINNTIYGLANSVYGIELMGTNETVISNNITADGNYTLGIGSSGDKNGLIIKDNNIILNGLGLSNPTTGDSIESANIGIVIYKNNGIIEGNNISSTGYYGINLTSTTKNTVTNNNIIANNTVGDYAVYAVEDNTVNNNNPIKNQSNIKIDIDDYGNILVNLFDSNGNPIPDANIIYSVNGTEVGTITTDKKGIANVTGLEGKIYFTANFTGNKYFFESSASDNFIIVKKSPRLATNIVSSDFTQTAVDFYNGERGGYFSVVLKDSEGNVLAGKPVSIGFNGVVYNLVTDASGVAKLQINLAWAGIYTFAIAFLGDDDYNGSFVVNKITVNSKATTILVGGLSTLKVNTYRTLTFVLKGVSALDSKKYVNAVGKKLVVTVNGKVYNLKTDKNGKATLKVKFSSAGTYTITTRFAGDGTFAAKTVTSKITVRR